MKFNTFGKLSLASVLVSAALAANAGISVENEQGLFTIGGDVEYDLNFVDKDRNNQGTQDFSQSGRILVQIAAEREVANDHYLRVQVQPLLKSSGDVDLDDAFFAIGRQADWELKIGRFEGFDMFPVGQDTMLDFAADAEPYRMKDARGRGDYGQVSYAKSIDSLYFELGSLFKQNDGADKNAVFVRPVVAFQATDNLRFAAALEANLTADKADAANDYLGYGATVNYSVQDFSLDLSYAYRDFDVTGTKEDTSIGAVIQYKRFGLGHIYSQADTGSKEKMNTTWASYEIANVMDVQDFSIYLGSYFSKVDNAADDQDVGVRVRFKYFF
ncbi:carbohydrate porin [Vibrio metschnikovii]|uniref:carbohydrate porin n=1 Tax=Vibrio TaxID=662 RepID=UPI0009323826|nr:MULTISPECIES: carbohydrate porin [Vibrio]EKO3572899.1 carbohydrate porin [Vibrio metschnikovii]EKO3671944.1 carbohydrate porin [Vibrio metschnikovii]EKO3777616.1 carbohydrate porin [Vibrio metschnikovii]MDQ2109379.1 porin [Vibrio sp. 2017_1457_15]MDQ2161766.1 porin [Vibrio sp. 2017_1457_13]